MFIDAHYHKNHLQYRICYHRTYAQEMYTTGDINVSEAFHAQLINFPINLNSNLNCLIKVYTSLFWKFTKNEQTIHYYYESSDFKEDAFNELSSSSSMFSHERHGWNPTSPNCFHRWYHTNVHLILRFRIRCCWGIALDAIRRIDDSCNKWVYTPTCILYQSGMSRSCIVPLPSSICNKISPTCLVDNDVYTKFRRIVDRF